MITLILVLLWIHFIVDYFFQSKLVAELKSTHVKWLWFHVLTYSAWFTLFAAIINSNEAYLTWKNFTFLAILNCLTHFIVDHISSAYSAKSYANKNIRAFIKGIGTDQMIHITILIILIRLFSK